MNLRYETRTSGVHDHPDLLTVPEVASWLRTPEATLRYWRHAGIGPRSLRIGRRVMYRRSDVADWIDAEAARTSRGGA